MKIFVMLSVLILLCCSGRIAEKQKSPSDVNPVRQEASLRWNASELIGYTYTLVDDKGEAVFRFTEHGTILHTAGPKGGPYTGPLLYWAIDDKGILNMGGSPGFTSVSWIKLEVTGDNVVVYSEGRRQIYIRSQK
jgi:hypothetical protein